jgi:hypothetical protein
MRACRAVHAAPARPVSLVAELQDEVAEVRRHEARQARAVRARQQAAREARVHAARATRWVGTGLEGPVSLPAALVRASVSSPAPVVPPPAPVVPPLAPIAMAPLQQRWWRRRLAKAVPVAGPRPAVRALAVALVVAGAFAFAVLSASASSPAADHVDDVAERRVAAMRGDFLSPEMAARFGPKKPIVHFTDEHAEAMMPRDYQYGYRAGQKAKFCL